MKKNSRRKWVGKRRPPEIWIPKDEVQDELSFMQKLHPDSSLDEVIAELEQMGHVSVRINPSSGKREFRLNQGAIQAALRKLPPEQRTGREITIHEDIAMICDYHHDATTLLSVMVQQTDRLKETDTIPWIIKSPEQLEKEIFGTCEDLPAAFAFLKARNFVEIAEQGPQTYRYRLNVPIVQAALDALPA
ncbi:MAG: hypothetical protein ACRDIV_17840 [Ktedonobacteraceae bacterium]